MKKILTALLLLMITGLICTVEFIYIGTTTDEYTEKLDTLEELMYEGDLQSALEYSKELNHSWNEAADKIDTLLYHDYVDNISVLLESIPDYIEYGDPGTLHATCKEAKVLLKSLKDSEYPVLQNII